MCVCIVYVNVDLVATLPSLSTCSNFVNLHHLRVSVGLKSMPFNPHILAPIGSAEHSMARCLEALRNLRDVSGVELSLDPPFRVI